MALTASGLGSAVIGTIMAVLILSGTTGHTIQWADGQSALSATLTLSAFSLMFVVPSMIFGATPTAILLTRHELTGAKSLLLCLTGAALTAGLWVFFLGGGKFSSEPFYPVMVTLFALPAAIILWWRLEPKTKGLEP